MKYHYPQKQIINGGRAHESRIRRLVLLWQGDQIISEGKIYLFKINLNILLYALKGKNPFHRSLSLPNQRKGAAFNGKLNQSDPRKRWFYRSEPQNEISEVDLFYFLFLLVIAYETLIKPNFSSLTENLWLPKTTADVNNYLCKGGWLYRTHSKRNKKDQTLFLTSQLISISCGKRPSILIFSGFLSGAVQKKEYRFCRHC